MRARCSDGHQCARHWKCSPGHRSNRAVYRASRDGVFCCTPVLVCPVSADSKYWLEQQPANMFNAFALSNICELMDDKDTHKLFSEVIRTAKPGARIIFRNLMIPREVPEDLQNCIIKNEELSKELQQQDRSFVYGKVAAYTVNK